MERQGSPSLFSAGSDNESRFNVDSDVESERPVLKDANGESSAKPFSEEVVAVLESLYRMGMIGWGKRHTREIHTAVTSTGLSHSQVEVCCNMYLMVNLKLIPLLSHKELDQMAQHEKAAC